MSPDLGVNTDCRFGIQEVWEQNLDEEMENIRKVIQDYPYVAMDTEFPGVVARPVGTFKSQTEYHFQTLRCNIDLLRIIQLGLTFSNDKGELPKDVGTWQFNFKFSLNDDMYAQDSIELLQRSGIDFSVHEKHGIDPHHFGELLITSGVVLCSNVRWISFHSGYDFGYLFKVLSFENIPSDEAAFFELLKLYFPNIYDIKYIMQNCKSLKGGLQDVADDLKVERVGPQHQAGSDALLTMLTFFKLRSVFFDECIDDSKYLGQLYGLGTSYKNQISGTGSNEGLNLNSRFNGAE